MGQKSARVHILLGFLVCLWVTGCGGGESSSNPVMQPTAPTVTVTPSSSNITTVQSLSVSVTVAGSGGTPVGSIVLTCGSYTSAAAALNSGGASISIPAGSLAVGTDTLTVAYTPSAASSSIYKSASGTASVIVTASSSPTVPMVTVTPSSSSITAAQSLSVSVNVAGGSGTPTGSISLTSGSYISVATTLSNGSASISIPAGSLATGTDTLTVTYTPDAASSSIYKSASGTASVSVTGVTTTYVLTVNSVAPSSGITVSVSPADNNGASNGTTSFTRTYNSGTQVTLSAPLSFGSYSFVSWSGCTSNPSASICDVTMNAAASVTATYNEPGITSITVTPNAAIIGTQVQFAASVQGNGSFSKSVSWTVTGPTGNSLSPGDIGSTGLYTTPYPAPATVTVTATSTQDTTKTGSVTVTLSQTAAAAGPALTVDAGNPTHAISPLIYGMNGYFLDTASAKAAHPAIIRWGGDDISRYDYQTNTTNSASDYYFENFTGAGNMFGGGNFTGLIMSDTSIDASTLGTVPVLGWVANNTLGACSFTESSYPGQTSYNGNCGSGIDADGTAGCTTSGGCDLLGSDTIAALTSVSKPPPDITAASTPAPGSVTTTWADGTWPGGWVDSIQNTYGPANPSTGTGAGVSIWDLDNEPTWWDAVHRDVHPNPFTYDEVTNGGIGTALAIKTADPTALVSGPVMDYWWAYFYSKKDIESGWGTGPCYQPWSSPADRTAHGGVPMIEYYLQQFKKYSQSYGTRLLDFVDVHAYLAADFDGSGVGLTTAGDTAEQQVRMNSTRVFWDPTYTDPNYSQPNYITDPNYTASCTPPLQAPQLIRMMTQQWVPNYPGTKTAVDEYNFGGLESINGAVTQADILGIFGREGLDLGALWPTDAYNTQGPGNMAFAIYRNYDGSNSAFGDTALASTSTSSSNADGEGQLAVYGALRGSDNALTIVVVNKTYGNLTSTLSLANFTASSTIAQVYLYSNANLNGIVAQPGITVTPPIAGSTISTISASFPAQSITLLIVPN